MTRAKKTMLILLITCLTAVITTGCWNNRDLTELGIAIAVGFDRTPGGELVFTAQIVKPGILKARQQGSEVDAFWTYSAGGETVFSAIRNLLTTLDRKTYFAHVQLLVIGEELAREGIAEILDIFERDQETNRQAYVLITRGITAQKLLETPSDLEDLPGLQLKAVIDNNSALAKLRKIVLFDLLKCLNQPGFYPTIAVVQLHQAKDEAKEIRDLEIKGSAVFKKDRLIGWLDPFATRGLLFARDEVESGIINIENPVKKDKMIAFEIISSSGKTGVKLEKGKPVLTIEVKAQGRTGSQSGPDVSTADTLQEADKRVAEVIEDDIHKVVHLAQQEYKADIFDFASQVHQNYPQYWKSVSKDWPQVFSKAPVEVKVSYMSKSTGLIKEPTRAK